MTTRLDVESPEALVEPRLYVPGATSTVSPAEATVTASWIVPNAVSSDVPAPDAPYLASSTYHVFAAVNVMPTSAKLHAVICLSLSIVYRPFDTRFLATRVYQFSSPLSTKRSFRHRMEQVYFPLPSAISAGAPVTFASFSSGRPSHERTSGAETPVIVTFVSASVRTLATENTSG